MAGVNSTSRAMQLYKIKPLQFSLFLFERVLRQAVGIEGIRFHAGGAAVGALDLIFLGIHHL
jgi:hypothetical protein